MSVWLRWAWYRFVKSSFCVRCDKPVHPSHYRRCRCVVIDVDQIPALRQALDKLGQAATGEDE
jgi:hypothetical protein